MLDRMLPAGVHAVDADGHAELAESELDPLELAAIEGAVSKRRMEFASVRACARKALSRLGQSPLPIVPGPGGAPIWPKDVVGSMTHCDGYRAAAVASSLDYAGIGIDAEPNEPLPGATLGLVASDSERQQLTNLGRRGQEVAWDRALFSAKESVFKCWFPLTGSWVAFDQAEVRFQTDGIFTAQLRYDSTDRPTAGKGACMRGRWMVHRSYVMTAVWLEHGLVRVSSAPRPTGAVIRKPGYRPSFDERPKETPSA